MEIKNNRDTYFNSVINRYYVEKPFGIPNQFVETSIFYRFIKRSIDLVGSGMGILILLPVFAIVGFLIKLDGGPAFFRQKRVGKDGEIFEILKFRSMCIDAEAKLSDLMEQNEIEGAMFKMKNDPRITPIGRFIRKTSIDELPQLWNIFKGDMSLVGPRPPIVHEVEEYSAKDKKRLTVKPGASGLWQVSGRNELSFHEMVDLDIKYIKNQSVKQDLTIILRTLHVVIEPMIRKNSKNGAY
ncbi:MAG: sugar transferase [Streptococcaceae bacterium]|nr:sugar transferase [Streptococcaceae bacterium]